MPEGGGRVHRGGGACPAGPGGLSGKGGGGRREQAADAHSPEGERVETDPGRLARAYHERTKHSAASVMSDTHFLDWDNQPLPFKVYEDLAPIPLPAEPPRAEVPVLACLAAGGGGRPEGFAPRLEAIARLFFLT